MEGIRGLTCELIEGRGGTHAFMCDSAIRNAAPTQPPIQSPDGYYEDWSTSD